MHVPCVHFHPKKEEKFGLMVLSSSQLSSVCKIWCWLAWFKMATQATFRFVPTTFFFLTTFDPFCWLSNRFFFLLKSIHLTDLTALQLALNKLGCFIGKKDCFLLANVRRLLYEFFFTPTPSNGSRSFGEVPHCQMVEHVPVILATVRIWVEFRMSRMSQNVHFASKCHFI